MPDKKRRFDEGKLIDLLISYDYCQSPESGGKIRKEIEDFIDSEIVRNRKEAQLEVLEKVRQTPWCDPPDDKYDEGINSAREDVNRKIEALKSEIVEGKG